MGFSFASTSATPHAKAASRGFTLIELMISVVLGLIIVAGLAGLMIGGNRSYRQDELTSRLQNELRFAMAQISTDLEMTQFWGIKPDPTTIELDGSLSINTDCGPSPNKPAPLNVAPHTIWAYGTFNPLQYPPLEYANNATGTAAAAAFPCITAGEFQANTDVIALKRLAENWTTTVPSGEADSRTGMVTDHVYLRTNGTESVLFKHPAVPAIVLAPPYQYWEYVPKIYYIRKHSDTPGDGIPSLCRERLTVDGGPSFEAQCIARGIENLQLEFGIDSSGDGVADFFQETPSAADLLNATAVRISLLARAEEAYPGYTNQKTYQLTPTYSVTPNDRFYRRSMTTTVLLRNPAAVRRLD